MKNIVGFIFILVLLFSCSGKKEKETNSPQKTEFVDTLKVVVEDEPVVSEDSLLEVEEDVLLPIRADELFDDFVYNFASNPRMQINRIVFPLPYYLKNEVVRIEKEDWKLDSLFLRDDYYTLLFDQEEDMELTQDTSLNSVQFEWIDLKRPKIQRYYFERVNGEWMLEGINEFERETIGKKEDFIDFFYHFASDSLFQSKRVVQPLAFVTTDPDDDFSVMEASLDLEQWMAFKPILPINRLSNINYGQKNEIKSRTKVLFLKGLGNGFSNTLYFKRIDGLWKLVKFEDTSN